MQRRSLEWPSGHVSTETNSPVGEREIKIGQGNCATSGNLTSGGGSEEREIVCRVRRGETLSFEKLDVNGEKTTRSMTRADA